MRVRQKSLKLPPWSRPGLTGPLSGWRRGFTSTGWEWGSEANHPGILSSRPPFFQLFCLALFPGPWSHAELPDLSCYFFRGCANCVKPVFCSGRQTACSRRQATWRLKASNKWSLWWLDQWLRACLTSTKGSWPSQNFPHLLAHPHPRGAGGCLLQWSWPHQPKSLKLQHQTHWLNSSRRHIGEGGPSLTVPQPKKATINTEMAPLCINIVDLSLLGWGVPGGTHNLLCCHMHPCALGPFGHEGIISLLPQYILQCWSPQTT